MNMKKQIKIVGSITLVLIIAMIATSMKTEPSDQDLLSLSQQLADLTAQASGKDDAAIILYINTFNKVYQSAAHKDQLVKYKTWFDEQVAKNKQDASIYIIDINGIRPSPKPFRYHDKDKQ